MKRNLPFLALVVALLILHLGQGALGAPARKSTGSSPVVQSPAPARTLPMLPLPSISQMQRPLPGQRGAPPYHGPRLPVPLGGPPPAVQGPGVPAQMVKGRITRVVYGMSAYRVELEGGRQPGLNDVFRVTRETESVCDVITANLMGTGIAVVPTDPVPGREPKVGDQVLLIRNNAANFAVTKLQTLADFREQQFDVNLQNQLERDRYRGLHDIYRSGVNVYGNPPGRDFWIHGR